MTRPDVSPANAFEQLLRTIDRALRGRMRTIAGDDASARLQSLREEVTAHRERVRGGGSVDGDWIRRTIREVAGWAPESDVSLLAALGAVARCAPSSRGAG